MKNMTTLFEFVWTFIIIIINLSALIMGVYILKNQRKGYGLFKVFEREKSTVVCCILSLIILTHMLANLIINTKT